MSIKHPDQQRVTQFINKWKDFKKETSGAQIFYTEFLALFDKDALSVGEFERTVKTATKKQGEIDFLWSGILLAEAKSAGKKLSDAYDQAKDYIGGLSKKDTPDFVMVSDFGNVHLYDHRNSEITSIELKLAELYEYIERGYFDFIGGGETRKVEKEKALTQEAVGLLGGLYDEISKIEGNSGSENLDNSLKQFMVRVLYCLFAEDTGIFQPNAFTKFVEETLVDIDKIPEFFKDLFENLNKKQQNPFYKEKFDYINGDLFGKTEIIPPKFNTNVKESLLQCCKFDWRNISPEIFGSLFQFVADPSKRRDFGEHYTRESIIQNTIRPLFIDDLEIEYKKALERLEDGQQINAKKNNLKKLLNKIQNLNILDPACGCGNFLVVSYREIRRIESMIEKSLGENISVFDVDHMHGIEIDSFACEIAKVAMWLTDHQCNMRYNTGARIPLKKSANIVCTNSLRTDWNKIIPVDKISYIVGNPPFVGSKMQSGGQRGEVVGTFHGIRNTNILDYVTCWYKKASEIIEQNHNIKVAFISTNSITQGQQVAPLWSGLKTHNVELFFAHRTFVWSSEVRAGMAAVHCVILGLEHSSKKSQKRLFDYPNIKEEAQELVVEKGINGYLLDAEDIVIKERSKPISSSFPEMSFGNMPNDGGNLIINSQDEYDDLVIQCPKAKKWIKKFIGAKELINNKVRYCLWLVGITPNELKAMKPIYSRVIGVQNHREGSNRDATRDRADEPHLFGEIRQSTRAENLVVPRVSSENRKYVPMAYFGKDTIISDANQMISNCPKWLFAILTSRAHMVWLDKIGGRLKSDYRYSNRLVYNCFPAPELSDDKKKKLNESAQKILVERKKAKNSTLASLYDSITMPKDLRDAHKQNDALVEKILFKKEKLTDDKILSSLFEKYSSLVSGALIKLNEKKKKGRKVTTKKMK